MSLKNHAFAAAVITAGALLVGLEPARAAGKLCKLSISANDRMEYSTKVMTAGPGCSEIEVTLKDTGKQPRLLMGHDWVLVEAKDLQAVAHAGALAGLPNNYQMPGDTRIIAATKVIGGGKSTSVTFPASKLKKGGSYMYLCTVPAHDALMRGVFHYR
ncbi:MAG: azurin [Steroidobacteraceae bacterium]